MHERDDDPAPEVPSPGDADRPDDSPLAALTKAIPPKPELPLPPSGFDDRLLGALSRGWRLLPGEDEKEIDLGTGWRRRLRDIAWRLLRPILERQQQFNTLLVQHFDGNIRAAYDRRESEAAVLATLDRHLGSLAAFQPHIVAYLRHLDESGEDLRRSIDLLRRTTQHTTEGLRESVDAQGRAAEDLRQSVELATASAHGLKREVERLRRRSSPPSGPAAADRPGLASADAAGAGRAADADVLRADAAGAAAADVLRADAAGAADAGRGAADAGDASRPPIPEETDLDAYQYVCFEDVFRGEPEEIAARQRDYLPYFEGASDVLDIGCGRGEFLALLREEGIAARGVDLNAEAIERCRERGLEAARSDALAYLRALADESMGGLFSAQVVEHLEADYLMQVLGNACRVLRPGSRIVLETINPASWTAFFSAYVRDITHRHPLHPETLAYLLRASGFVDVDIVYRAPVPDAAKLQRAAVDESLADTPAGKAVCVLADTVNQHADRLNGLMFAEQDYAAVARRP
ncbi:MAG: class I SAM-dependent methyltransferase [Acidobacteria bacterium]|nr:class I SAM-dependent methyltransferase [Acidobacteriota bacterium]